jgi:hypothetical protein
MPKNTFGDLFRDIMEYGEKEPQGAVRESGIHNLSVLGMLSTFVKDRYKQVVER